jgi:hypothetical protein
MIGTVELIIVAGVLILVLALVVALVRRADSSGRSPAEYVASDGRRADLDALERRIARLEAKTDTLVSEPGAAPQPSAPDEQEEIIALLRAGHKIQAIKRYREMTDLGLKEAKDAVDAIEARLRQSGRI